MRLGQTRDCGAHRIPRMDRLGQNGVGLHPFVEHSRRSFGSRIPFIRSLAMSLKLWHAKNMAVNRESVSSTRKAASVRFH
jgi:hypothetical protein